MIMLKQIDKLADKMKWQRRFCAAYRGGLSAWSDKLFDPVAKFYVAVDDGKELGYIRMLNCGDDFARYSNEVVESISEGYVKPAYRKNGVLRGMITIAVRDHNVKLLYIETERLLQLQSYYSSLGFSTYCGAADDPLMSYAILNSFDWVISAANDDQFQSAA